MPKDKFDEIDAYLNKRKLEIIYPEDNALQYYVNKKRMLNMLITKNLLKQFLCLMRCEQQ